MEKTRTTRWRAVTRRCWRPGGKATRRWLTATSPWRNCENFLKNQRPTEKRRGGGVLKTGAKQFYVAYKPAQSRESFFTSPFDGLGIVATPLGDNSTP